MSCDFDLNVASVEAVGAILNDSTKPLPARFRALFTLRNIGGPVAIHNIAQCFSDDSALLKHECAYCLGQIQDPLAIPMLVDVLKDITENTMVRHEAGEALGAIGSAETLELLTKHSQDSVVEVAETCQLATERIQWLASGEEDKLRASAYRSVDPAPPLLGDQDTPTLRKLLLDESQPLFLRYRAMFSLRNQGDSESVLALAEGLSCCSALFRHEVAYVLGQLQHEAATDGLISSLADQQEDSMVRHECAEALGSIATARCMETLTHYLKDPERVVRESCQVALDMSEHENSTELQYADTLTHVPCP